MSGDRAPLGIRALLRLFPRTFRDRYGRELLDTYQRRERPASRAGALALLRFRVRETADLVGTLLREWRHTMNYSTFRERETEIMQNILADIRFAVRALLRRPGFSWMIVLTLAIGIGASTAVFSMIHAVLLRPLPLPEAERLVAVKTHDLKRQGYYSIAYPDFQQWVQEGVFDAVGLYTGTTLDLTGGGEPERLRGDQVTDGFFDALGLAPVRGRLFDPQEYLPGAAEVVILSHGFWRRRFGGDDAVIGSRIMLDGTPETVVGVLPPEASIRRVDVWVPYRVGPVPRPELQEWDNYFAGALARLAPGTSLETTNTRLAALAAEVAARDPRERDGISIEAEPFLDFLTGSSLRLIFTVLFGTVLMVLLIGSVNTANLMLTRASERDRELRVRAVLGAGRWRLVRLQSIEALLLSFAGMAAGLLIASWGIRALVRFSPAQVLRLEDAGLSIPVLLFALVLAFFSAFLFGVWPALRGGSSRQGALVARGGRTSTVERHRQRGRRRLVTIEVALSVVLLSGAGLTIHSLAALNRTSPGFETDHLLTVPITLPRARYSPGEPVRTFYRTIAERLDRLPSLRTVGLRSVLPLGGDGVDLWRAFLAEGWPEPPEGDEIIAPWVVVSPGLFRTEGLPLLKGRDFAEVDEPESEPVMVVNRTFADQMFPGEDAIGKRVRSWRDENIYRTIVGIVGDERHRGLDDELRPIVYVPHEQSLWRSMTIVARTGQEPLASAGTVRDLIHEIDPELVVSGASTMSQVLDASLARPRLIRSLLGMFAVIALVLAFLGIFGVLSYHVVTRTREIGVRVAVGAGRGDVIRLLLQDGGRVITAGLLIGLPIAAAEGWLMRRLLYGVPTVDLVVLAGVCGTILLAAVPAVLLPTLRALRVDPVAALRSE